jgi:cell division protein FtsB
MTLSGVFGRRVWEFCTTEFMNSNQTKLLRFFSSKLFTVLVIAVIFLVGLAFYQDFIKQQDLSQELTKLDTDIAQLADKKIELARLIDILESSNYTEREARLRLGLKKEGEKVISVPANARPSGEVLGQATKLENKKPNPLQWFDFFFFSPPRQ